MGATGFFNPLTGFALAFRDKLGESAARERAIDLERQRMSSDERKQKGKNDSDERIADRRARSNETVADRQARAHEYGSDKDLEGKKYTADKMVEREKAAQGKISDGIIRNIQREADKRKDEHDRALKLWREAQSDVERINKGIDGVVGKIKSEVPGDVFGNLWPNKLSDKQVQDLKDQAIKKYLGEELKKMPPAKRQYFNLAPDGQSIEFTGSDPGEFDPQAWKLQKMEDMGVRLEDRLSSERPMIPVQPGGRTDREFMQPGDPDGSGQAAVDKTFGGLPVPHNQDPSDPRKILPYYQNSGAAAGMRKADHLVDGLPQDGESIVTIGGVPYIANGRITVPIPRGMGRALGVPGEMLNPPPVRDEMWGMPQDTPQISPYGVFFQ